VGDRRRRTGMIYQLDSDTYSHAYDGRLGVRERIDAVRARGDTVAISVMTRVEALRPRFESIQKAATAVDLVAALERLTRTEAFLAEFPVLGFNHLGVAHFDRFRKERRFRHTKRGDMLHACIALGNAARFVTRNTADFHRYPGLELENWAD
jgi:tRNA(fMet)-specific endonuclease VapC